MLWQGRPDGRFELFPMRLDYWMFGFAVCLIPLYNFVFLPLTGPSNDQPWPFSSPASVWTIQIVGALLYSVVRPWFDKMRRLRLRYAITDGRAIRVDSKTGRTLSEKGLSNARVVEIARHNTLRIDPEQTGFAAVPMDWRIIRTGTSRKGIVGSYSGMQMAINGYDEYGFEFRMLRDPEQVRNLLLSRMAMAAP